MRFRKSQAQEETARDAAHSRHVTHGPRKTLPPHGVGWMFVAQEVGAFEEPVTRQNRFMACLWHKDGGVIANSHWKR
jgi:hypothetical protein